MSVVRRRKIINTPPQRRLLEGRREWKCVRGDKSVRWYIKFIKTFLLAAPARHNRLLWFMKRNFHGVFPRRRQFFAPRMMMLNTMCVMESLFAPLNLHPGALASECQWTLERTRNNMAHSANAFHHHNRKLVSSLCHLNERIFLQTQKISN